MKNAELLHPPHPQPHSLGMGAGAVLLGFALLLAGRQLFWLFVAALGFVFAEDMASRYFTHLDPAAALIISILVGLAGALLAIFVQKLAIGLAGAMAGAYYLQGLLAASSLNDPRYFWIAIVAGAVIGALLFLALFKWALIFFSSVVGAHLIAHALKMFEIDLRIRFVIFLVLVVVGVFFQAGRRRRAVDEEE